MTNHTRTLPTIVGALASAALLALGASPVGAKSRGKKDSGTLYAAVTHSAGGFSYAAGDGTDKILGNVAVVYKFKVGPGTAGTLKVSAKPVVVYTATGSLTGTATSTLTIAADGTETFTNGKLSLKHGTGSQRGHSFTATLTGTGNTKIGRFTFHYKGTYR